MGVFIDLVAQPGNIVYIAAATQAAGMLFRSQIILRVLLLLGSGLYLVYYATAAENPLWQAMAATTAISLANIYGISMLLLSRSVRIIPAHQFALFKMLDGMEPGDFRALMRFGQTRTLQREEALTVKGEVPDRLFYVIEGEVEIEKKTAPRFRIAPRNFIGEVSLVLGSPASATVLAPPGTRIIEWPRDRLTKQMDRRNRLKLAIEALIARDMARKVAIGSGTLAEASHLTSSPASSRDADLAPQHSSPFPCRTRRANEALIDACRQHR